MATQKIKSAGDVLTDFLQTQEENAELDAASIEAIRDLRSDSKLTKTNLLRKLEDARNAALTDAPAETDAEHD